MASSSKRDIVLETYPLSYNTHTIRTYLMFHSFLDLLKWCTIWLGDRKVLTLTVNRSSERLLSQFLLHETLDVKIDCQCIGRLDEGLRALYGVCWPTSRVEVPPWNLGCMQRQRGNAGRILFRQAKFYIESSNKRQDFFYEWQDGKILLLGYCGPMFD